MKKLLLFAAAGLCCAAGANAQDINLPEPQTTGGMPLMEAIAARRTVRAYSERPLAPQTVADLLWSAWGISSADGKRTVPTARNQQDIDVYAVMADGTYLYDAKNNLLKQVTTEDLRPLLAKQDFVSSAPLHLLFVSANKKYGGMHAGSMYQNVGLACTSMGLANVVRGMIDNEQLKQKLNLPEEEEVIISQTIGYPAE